MTDLSRRNKANKAKGARWQSELRNGLRNQGFDVERLVLTGKEDEGDLVVRATGTERVVIEAKDATMDVGTFCREAMTEADNYAKHRDLDRTDVKGVAVVKRRGKNWREAYVITTLADYFGLDAP
jgi:Holliday junction resolvase